MNLHIRGRAAISVYSGVAAGGGERPHGEFVLLGELPGNSR